MSQLYDLTQNSILVFGGTVTATKEFFIHCKRIQHQLNINPGIYHGQLEPNECKNCLQDFMDDKKNVIVCTSALGMGIDKDNVRCVIDLMLPLNIEEYYQQIGRSGRDGKQSHAYVITYPNDFFAKNVNNGYAKMMGLFKENRCLRKYILRHFDDQDYIQDTKYPCCCLCEKMRYYMQCIQYCFFISQFLKIF